MNREEAIKLLVEHQLWLSCPPEPEGNRCMQIARAIEIALKDMRAAERMEKKHDGVSAYKHL